MVATLLSIFSAFSTEMANQRQRTFIMIKPDGVQRGLVSEVIRRFEQRGLKLVAMKFMVAPEALLKKHYADLSGLSFFNGLVKFIGSGPVVPMVWEGNQSIKIGRDILGATKPQESKPGTLRGDYGIDVGRNIVHGSDGEESAQKEISLWFNQDELVDWQSGLEPYIYE